MRIGFIVDILNEEYQISVLRGMKMFAKQNNIELVCFQYENFIDNVLLNCLPKKEFFSLDGVIVLTSVVQDRMIVKNFESLKNTFGNIHFVSVGQELQGVPSIISESKKSMYELLNHLIEEHSYKNILFLSGRTSHQDNIVREEAFIRTMEKFKAEKKVNLYKIIRGEYTEESAIRALTIFDEANHKQKFDAIVCANDNMAIGVNKYLKMYKTKSFTENCAITGFDDVPQAKFEHPSLTTVRQPMEEMGKRAVQIMCNLINGQNVNAVEVVDSDFVIRASCGCSEEKKEDVKSLISQNRYMQYQYLYSEKLLRMINQMGQQLNSVLSIQEMRQFIDRNLDSINVSNFCILSFMEDKDGVGKYVYPIYVRKDNKMIEQFYSVPKTLISDFCNFFFDWKESYVSNFLMLGKDSTGIIFYQADDFLHPYICSFSVNIAQTILRLKTREEDFKYAETLEKEVLNRTKEIIESNKKRIEVEEQILKISEAERLRFSTDLHDDICQRLAGISMLCRSYSNRNAPIEKSEMIELATLISDTLQRTRQYAHNSFPVELENLGLNHSINNLCASFENQTGIKCVYEWEVLNEIEFNNLQKLNIFRIIQEALHNVLKHSKATQVDVKIFEEKNYILVIVKDNGVGFSDVVESDGEDKNATTQDDVEDLSFKQVSKGIGLTSMQYRADQINASFKIKKNKPCGTCVELKVFPH